jgi:hypothetical protein
MHFDVFAHTQYRQKCCVRGGSKMVLLAIQAVRQSDIVESARAAAMRQLREEIIFSCQSWIKK